MIKEKLFRDPIFEAAFIVTFGKMADLKEWYEKKFIVCNINENHQAFCESLKDNHGIPVCHIHFEAYGFTTIVHETNHASFLVLSERGIPFVHETKEVFAYYQDWLAGQCRDLLENWTKSLDKEKN